MTNADLKRLKCAHAANCPGCPEIRQIYAKQLNDKKKHLNTVFAPLLKKAELSIPALIPSPKIQGYRTTSKLCLHQSTKSGVAIGIYRRNSKVVAHIPDCPVHDPAINNMINAIFMNSLLHIPFPFYNHSRSKYQLGTLKFITLRTNPLTQEIGVILTHTGIPSEDLKKWLRQLKLENIPFYGSHLKERDQGRILSQNIQHLDGPERITLTIGDTLHQLSPMSFAQANTSLLPAFHAHITQDFRGDTLLDLYSGFGAYGISLNTNFRKIILVEGDKFAINDAVHNVLRLKLRNVFPTAAFCENFLEKRLSPRQRDDVTHIIVNPPRTGLSDRVKKMLTLKAFPSLTHLTYVSCNPQTLYRDLVELCSEPQMQLKSLQGFDMFPQTNHIESVAKLEIKRN